jgi:hypothetical protein
LKGDKTTPSKKRKAPEELSTNPNTAKSRARNDRLAQDPITKQILASEKADQQAVTRAYAKLETNQEYQKASSEMKISMREQVRQAKLNERYVYIGTCVSIFVLTLVKAYARKSYRQPKGGARP